MSKFRNKGHLCYCIPFGIMKVLIRVCLFNINQ
ncbi:hypothetical protein CoNPh26_CDS0070 [Staphylococcus phage S-CoN_Ph26]|nr:hypothetical protein CoNPh26_CDS0070 [Staphylococcus phage S-CoN_Ph26]